MHPVFSINGQHVAWLMDDYVYNTNGHPIGYASGSGIFSLKNAAYIGQIESGESFIFRGSLAALGKEEGERSQS